MKISSFVTLLIFATCVLQGQEGSVNIEQDDKIDQLLDIYKSSLSSSGYYTIQVGFVGSDTKANNLRSLVAIDFPNLSSRVDFESPTYRVKVGRFKTKLEGERKLAQVKRKYPAAMLLPPKKSTK